MSSYVVDKRHQILETPNFETHVLNYQTQYNDVHNVQDEKPTGAHKSRS